MSLNINEVNHLAKLARLELTPEEQTKYATEISEVLRYVGQLAELKTQPLAVDAAGVAELRDDVVIGWKLEDQAKLINQAPEIKDNLIKTKPVF